MNRPELMSIADSLNMGQSDRCLLQIRNRIDIRGRQFDSAHVYPSNYPIFGELAIQINMPVYCPPISIEDSVQSVIPPIEDRLHLFIICEKSVIGMVQLQLLRFDVRERFASN